MAKSSKSAATPAKAGGQPKSASMAPAKASAAAPVPASNALHASVSATSARDRLSGTFLECCDCYTICPCWVNETPDEDHCSGIYVWAFDELSMIAGKPLRGHCMAIAAYHGNRQGSQSVLFLDTSLAQDAREALQEAFVGKSKLKSLDAIRKLIGAVIDVRTAQITYTPPANKAAGWTLAIHVDGQQVVQANGASPEQGVELTNSALSKEFGAQGNVSVQKMGEYTLKLNTLPVGAFSYHGRAGMAGKFKYT